VLSRSAEPEHSATNPPSWRDRLSVFEDTLVCPPQRMGRTQLGDSVQ
jgi:hypothetical protein